MMRNKKYLLIFSIFFSLFMLFHLYSWYFKTSKIFDLEEDFQVGDLGRISYYSDALYPRKRTNNIDGFMTMDTWNGEAIDLFTIGTSFSNGASGGGYYQKYAVDYGQINVMHSIFEYKRERFLETIAMYYNSGLFEKMHVKNVLVETVERRVIPRIGMDFDINRRDEKLLDQLLHTPQRHYHSGNPPVPEIINLANFKVWLYPLLYQFSNNAFFSQTYILPLERELFSKAPDKLLFYFEDLDALPKATDEAIHRVNQNLNLLAALLAKSNINLLFMPVTDKYNLYLPYLKTNPYSHSRLFEGLRKEERQYHLVDTKKIFEPYLEKGHKDLFFPDDTHWSPAASKIIGEEIVNMIKSMKP